MIRRERFGMLEELVHFDDRDGQLVVIEQLSLVVKLHLVTIVLRQSPWESVRELEADEVQILKNWRFVLLHHVADMAGYVKHDTLPVNGTAIVLDFDGDAVAGSLPFTVVGQQQVRLGVPVAKFAWNEGVHEFRVLDAVGTDKVQGRVDEVGRERDVLLAGQDFLDAGVIVEIDILPFVLFHDGVCVLAVLVGVPKFVEELGKFFSSHWCPYSRQRKPSTYYINTLFCPVCPEKLCKNLL